MEAAAEPTEIMVPEASETAEIEALLHEHIAVLASDEFEGRAPATPGEEKTIAYLEQQFKSLGIGPGNADSYFQSVAVLKLPLLVMPFCSCKVVTMMQRLTTAKR